MHEAAVLRVLPDVVSAHRGWARHTRCPTAWSAVHAASVLGVSTDEAWGMALGPHVDVYKVCWFNGCYSSDIVAGIDDAMISWMSSPSLSATSPFHSSRTSSPSVAYGRQSEALSLSAPSGTTAPWRTPLPTRRPVWWRRKRRERGYFF
ncbi:hypothetical protein Cni_G25899 [Canna indica]|uniref:Uncharacterized protein n=1 Tax=Canna indica TaxID=4628 RepID=A0AAQ3KYV1_9LILI|nr:hypothetical protein Cni_G25899 [Canna indica]